MKNLQLKSLILLTGLMILGGSLVAKVTFEDLDTPVTVTKINSEKALLLAEQGQPSSRPENKFDAETRALNEFLNKLSPQELIDFYNTLDEVKDKADDYQQAIVDKRVEYQLPFKKPAVVTKKRVAIALLAILIAADIYQGTGWTKAILDTSINNICGVASFIWSWTPGHTLVERMSYNTKDIIFEHINKLQHQPSCRQWYFWSKPAEVCNKERFVYTLATLKDMIKSLLSTRLFQAK